MAVLSTPPLGRRIGLVDDMATMFCAIVFVVSWDFEFYFTSITLILTSQIFEGMLVHNYDNTSGIWDIPISLL